MRDATLRWLAWLAVIVAVALVVWALWLGPWWAEFNRPVGICGPDEIGCNL